MKTLSGILVATVQLPCSLLAKSALSDLSDGKLARLVALNTVVPRGDGAAGADGADGARGAQRGRQNFMLAKLLAAMMQLPFPREIHVCTWMN